ncbi:glycoside hydrolase [Hortaea werneckii]|nr:glycoside hydrolase [Hortaea werneckii]
MNTGSTGGLLATPHGASRGSQGMRLSSRRGLTCLGALLLIGLFFTLRQQDPRASDRFHSSFNLKPSELAGRRYQVIEAFDHAWRGYSTYCMGHDSIHPVTNTCDDDFGGLGATAIDALSSAIMFERSEVVTEILEFIAKVDFTKVTGGTSLQLFEVVIRHFGAMLSANDLLDGPFKHMQVDPHLRETLLNQTIKLGDVLSCGFSTPTGIPRNWVDPALCTTDSGTSNTLAGIGTLVLEFGRLSDITGHRVYVEKARKAEQYLINPTSAEQMPFPGIYGSFVSVMNGQLMDSKGSWGSLADSFYEYLVKMYIYDRDVYSTYLDRWRVAADSTIRYIASHAYGHPEWTLLPYWEGQRRFNAMDSLSWFAGGNFVLGGMITGNQTFVDFGLSIADTAGAMYSMTATGLGGEFVMWTEDCLGNWGEGPCTANNSVRLSDSSFKLRPEVLETWYYAYRATGDPKYREWAWSAFEAISKVCKTSTGFSAISDVNAPDGGKKLDMQESFVFAEVLKYVYLLHLEDDGNAFHVQDSRHGVKNEWVYNTEAHPFRVVGRLV